MSNPPPPHLDPSELGTKSYWDAAYTTEIKNFTSNSQDEGTIWFDDAGAESRMIKYLNSLEEQGELVRGDPPEDESRAFEEIDSDDPEYEEIMEETNNRKPSRRPTSFLDLGTGNAHLLIELRTEDDWHGRMVGIDYSGASIRLAKEICATRFNDICDSQNYREIELYEWDIIGSEPPLPWTKYGSSKDFDVVLDKGTFDAICLSQELDSTGRRICEGYREKVEELVKPGGRFLITSCNWTDEELRGWFAGEGSQLVFEDRVKYPSFRFGGKEGSSVVTLCFRRKDN